MKTPLLLTLLVLTAGAQAQTVWRCGADGRSYSDSPCPEGRAVDVMADARPARDIAAAHDIAERERTLADRMAAERRLRERVPAGGGLMGIRHERPAETVKPKLAKASAKRSKLQRLEEPDTWRATAPASQRKTG